MRLMLSHNFGPKRVRTARARGVIRTPRARSFFRVSISCRPRTSVLTAIPPPSTFVNLNRCGRRSYHIQKATCGACGYPSARKRNCECPTSRPATLPRQQNLSISKRPRVFTKCRSLTFRFSLSFRRQLVHQGYWSSHHGHRSHEIPQDPAPPLQDRFP